MVNAARKTDRKVDTKRVREWCKQEEKLLAVKNYGRTKRLSGAGRPFKCENMEGELNEWIRDRRERSLRVSRKMIQWKAKELFQNSSSSEKQDLNFSASDGWLSGFLKRNHLSLRRRTSVAQKLPDDVKEKIVRYLLYVEGLRKNCIYRPGSIAAADETPVWIDPVQDKTIEQTGARSVKLFSTGNHKTRFTVMLAALGDGKKLLPFIVMKGKKLPPELLNMKDCIIVMSDNGWMNEETTLDWLNKCWGTFSFGRRLLAWDAFCAHKTSKVKSALRKMQTDVAMIPGGCTSVLQALDISWNKPFKAAFASLYEEGVETTGCRDSNRTEAGNARPPCKSLLCQWVVKAWNTIGKDLILKSFIVSGLTSDLNGNDDGKLRAVKELGIGDFLREARRLEPPIDIENDVSSSDESISDSD